MQPFNHINLGLPQQGGGALPPLPGQPLPGQPLPQVLPVPPQDAAGNLPVMPVQPVQNPNVPAQPALVGGMVRAAGPVMDAPRNETMLEASALALNVVAAQGLQGQALKAARETVFHNFDQVKIEIPRDVEEVGFVCNQATLSGLNLKYLEMSASLDANIARGSTGHAYRFQDTSGFLKNALQALNAVAVQRNFRPRLGVEVVAASASDWEAMLDLTYDNFCSTLKADKLLVYLKIECLRRREEDDSRRFSGVMESLEGHSSLQKLVLADSWIDQRMALEIQTLLRETPSLTVLDLSACSASPQAVAILRAVRSAQVILPN